MRGVIAAVLFLAVAVAQPAAAFPNDDDAFPFAGPLGVVQQHPLRRALLDVPARGAVHRPWLRVERSAANIWNSETWLATKNGRVLHLTDLQEEAVTLDVGVPLGRFLSVGARLGGAQLWGGGPIDGVIEQFHQAFDFYNFDREYAARERAAMLVQGPDGAKLAWHGQRTILHSPILHAFARILENRTTRLMVRADMQLPLGDVARTLRLWAPELGLGISLWQRLAGIFNLYLAANVMWHGNNRVGGLTVNPVQWQLEGSLEIRILPWATFLVENRIQTPLFETNAVLLTDRTLSFRATAYNAYFTPVNIISFGPRLYLPADVTVTAYAGEDFMFCTECWDRRFSRETNAPDISAGVVLQHLIPVELF